MRPAQLEAWILLLVDQVSKGAKIEDSRVELKAEWPEPPKAARRIAGHDNASHGESVLWVIGLDENRGIVPVSIPDLADWVPQVSAQFDGGIAPSILLNLVVPAGGETLTGLLFDTARRPYVVKNSAHGKPEGGPVTLEVPWRDGTRVRSARREDLIRLLAPLQTLKPLADELQVNLHIAEDHPKIPDLGGSFLNQQYLRVIHEGSLSILPEPVRAIVLEAYTAMNAANAVLASVWTLEGLARHAALNSARLRVGAATPKIAEARQRLASFFST